jgi:hypothetical protein
MVSCPLLVNVALATCILLTLRHDLTTRKEGVKVLFWRANRSDSFREFPDLPRVEGTADADGGRFFYVTGEGVHSRFTRLLAH